MTKLVHVVGGVVDTVWLSPPLKDVEQTITIDGETHTVIVQTPDTAGLIEAPDDVFAGWSYDAVAGSYATPASSPKTVPQEISDVQFARQARVLGLMTQTEALAFVRTGDLSPALTAALASLPPEQQADAELVLSGERVFRRDHWLTVAFGVYFAGQAGAPDAEAWTDDFFRAAASG